MAKRLFLEDYLHGATAATEAGKWIITVALLKKSDREPGVYRGASCYRGRGSVAAAQVHSFAGESREDDTESSDGCSSGCVGRQVPYSHARLL